MTDQEDRIKALARTFAKRCEERIHQHITGMYLTYSGEMADTIRTALAEEIEEAHERRERFRRIMAEECPSDEKHCTCVPLLRAGAKRLEAQLAVAREALEKVAKEDSENWDGQIAREALAEMGDK